MAEELAVDLALLIGTELLNKSMARVQAVDPGFDARHALMFRVSLPVAWYPSNQAARSFADRARHRIAAVPGVRAVGAISNAPFDGTWFTSDVTIEGRSIAKGQPSPSGVFSAFSVLSVLLAAIGIYGVLGYLVQQRARELAIRFALGGSRRGVASVVVRRGLLLAAAGLGVGLGSALALTRLLSNQLFGVAPTDPASFAVSTILLLMVAAAAIAIPTARATRLDPMVVLRRE